MSFDINPRFETCTSYTESWGRFITVDQKALVPTLIQYLVPVLNQRQDLILAVQATTRPLGQ